MATEELNKVEALLEDAQLTFNDLREQALEYVPALATGYPLKSETVAIGGDGKLHVVEQ